MPRAKAVIEEPRKKSRDARVRITLETDEGIHTCSLVLVGFLGNTLSWQRNGKSLNEKFSESLRAAFGGNVRVE